MKNLLQLSKDTHLIIVLEMDQWLAVADEIRQGRCKIEYLSLHMYQGSIADAADAVKVVANAIRFDSNLEHLTLAMQNGVTGEAAVALAEALMVNTTLRVVTVSDMRTNLCAQAYEAFAAMMRVNISLVLEVPRRPPLFRTPGAGDEMLLDFWKQMLIEQRLNKVGRGRLLASRQTKKEEWVDALRKLSFTQFNDSPPDGVYNLNDSPAFRVSCMYSLLRLNPSVVCMP
jgi:hypothetical protein